MLIITRGKNPATIDEEFLLCTKSNVIGNIHLFNLFLPLLLKGKQKKVVFISSGHADLDLITKYNIDISGPYSALKAATNCVVAKFSAEYSKDGVLFMSISPGVVDTGHFDPTKREPLYSYFPVRMSDHKRRVKLMCSGLIVSDFELKSAMQTKAKFQNYAPHFKGPMTPEESVKQIIAVYEKASLANGDGGSFVSHLGTKQWL